VPVEDGEHPLHDWATGLWSVKSYPAKSASNTGRVMRCWASISIASVGGDAVVEVAPQARQELLELLGRAGWGR
jgi:hypothetical protein